MLRVLLLALILVMVSGAAQIAAMNKLPMIGERLVVAKSLRESSGVCMVSPGQMDKCIKATIGGVEYTIAFRAKSKKPAVVTYMHTADPKFRSPSGQRIGDVVEVRFDQTIKAPGFEIYAGAVSGGWTAVVGFNGKVETPSSNGEIELNSLRESDGPLRLRITGFSTR